MLYSLLIWFFSESLPLWSGRLEVLSEAPRWVRGRAVIETCTLLVATQPFNS